MSFTLSATDNMLSAEKASILYNGLNQSKVPSFSYRSFAEGYDYNDTE